MNNWVLFSTPRPKYKAVSASQSISHLKDLTWKAARVHKLKENLGFYAKLASAYSVYPG